jgi:ankyrin repeat protein
LINRADVNIQTDRGFTPLNIACQYGNYDSARMLLNYQADPNLECREGFTPLHVACADGFTNIVKMLLDKEVHVDPMTVGKKLTPLYMACCGGYEEIVEMLLDKQANFNHQCEDGATSLMVACEKCYHSTSR